MSATKPLVSVVIVNWNGLEDTKVCLKYLRQQTYKDFEVIVVDNGSQDNSVEWLRKQPGIILIENSQNLGFTGGHIGGYSAAAGEFVLLLNNDAIMDKGYLETAVDTMLSDEQIGAVGGRAYLWDKQNKLFDTTNDFYAYQVINPITAEGIFTQKDSDIPQEVNNVSGSCVMVRRSVTGEIGYLHNQFFAYYEESDLFARMKRAGYKVIYNPNLSIWHANAKSSNRKGASFSYYMMMRNRFRFATRNFDGWSLLRFYKFYLKMGIASIIKSVLPTEQQTMHRAYAKAFAYNLVLGWKPVLERWSLGRSIGKTNYNQLIVREQTGISVVVFCEKASQFDQLTSLANSLMPSDEILVVTSSGELIKKAREATGINPIIRLCIDRKFFDTHPQNLGAICAKNDWLIISGSSDIGGLSAALKKYSEAIYFVKRQSKKLACLAIGKHEINTFGESLKSGYSASLLVERSLFIDSGGLDKACEINNAIRQMVAYSFLGKTFSSLKGHELSDKLGRYSGHLTEFELQKKLTGILAQASSEHKKVNRLDKITMRYYRLAQARTLISWLFYWRIPLRLKAGRVKSIIFALLTLNSQMLASELKHMRNEVSVYKSSVNMVALKEQEEKRLEYLSKHPQETIFFIILRDRYEPLKKQLIWLERQGIKKIVFIDNDSKLPPLVDFLGSTNYQVLELGRNMAQTAPWSAGIIKVLLPDDFYIVTDPDIIPARQEPDVLGHLYNLHTKYPHHLKIGLGLKIDDLPDRYPLKNDVIKWESQFWRHELESGVYEASVDTTLALYKPFTYKYILHPSIRTGEPYTAQHLPWYNKGDKLSDEEVFYCLRADQSVNTWNKDHLPEKYKKELAKQRH